MLSTLNHYCITSYNIDTYTLHCNVMWPQILKNWLYCHNWSFSVLQGRLFLHLLHLLQNKWITRGLRMKFQDVSLLLEIKANRLGAFLLFPYRALYGWCCIISSPFIAIGWSQHPFWTKIVAVCKRQQHNRILPTATYDSHLSTVRLQFVQTT